VLVLVPLIVVVVVVVELGMRTALIPERGLVVFAR
jgi:hypothetical protein